MAHIGWAQAEIYKYIDADGHVTYSSSPIKGAKKLNLEPKGGMPSTVRAHNVDTSPSDFPRVDSNTQKNRDGARRKILEDELANEGKLLAEARQNLKNGYENQEAPMSKIKELQELVMLHEKNIEALKSELANLK